VSVRFSVDQLKRFAASVLARLGCPEEDAALAATILIAADMRGIESHGIVRLTNYVAMLRDGRANPRPKVRIVRESPSTTTLDGDGGLGLVVGPYAANLAFDKATTVGTGWTAVANSNHFGIAGYYALKAAERDLVGMAMTNATAVVAPLWGAERMLGPNPLAVAFPGLEEPPIVIDMAPTVSTMGAIVVAKREGRELREGWAVDRDGNPARHPDQMLDGGALLTLGGTRALGGHKGYCLAVMADIFSAVFSGANWGPFVPPFGTYAIGREPQVGKRLGHFFGAWRIDAFRDPTEFKQTIDLWIRTFRATKPARGTSGPLIPGDPEREAEAIAVRDGIALGDKVVEQLRAIAADCNVEL
jgi:LDH2 family malate/lactate/ureidoglycolate dehydrogenase